MVKIVDVRETPNPLARKFMADQVVATGRAKSWPNRQAAQKSALASALFNVNGVQSVFLLENAITINLSSAESWTSLIPELCFLLEEHLEKDEEKKLIDTNLAPMSPEEFLSLDLEKRLMRTNSVLDAKVRPGLAGDGGGLTLMEVNDLEISIHYIGACGNCPSAATGTLRFIQQILREHIHPNILVNMK